MHLRRHPCHALPPPEPACLTDQISDLVAEGDRTLVFSQFTRFLDAARERLEAAGIGCYYLDGATRDRATLLTEFKNGAAPVFLISLKAGGFGLTPQVPVALGLLVDRVVDDVAEQDEAHRHQVRTAVGPDGGQPGHPGRSNPLPDLVAGHSADGNSAHSPPPPPSQVTVAG
ncbi:helicase-related protein [Micromonospora soli]